MTDLLPSSAPDGRRLTRRSVVRGALAGGILLGAGGILSACGSDEPGSSAAASTGPVVPRRGGRLRIGVAGGGPQDSLDAHRSDASLVDAMRSNNLHEPLAIRDRDFRIQHVLAEEIAPERGKLDVWTIRLKDGLTFHDGRPVTSDEVVSSLQRILDPKDPKSAATALSSVDPRRIRVVDDRTVRLTLREPNANLLDDLARSTVAIVPKDYDPKHPIGTGPFRFRSFEPGRQSVFVRYDDYREAPKPYVDELVIVDLPDETARLNALLGGQVDAITDLPTSQRAAIRGRPGFAVLRAKTGNWHAFTLRVDTPPFDDVRVRQAFRLLADREQLVAQALAGEGRVANDVVSPLDPAYDRALPQRTQDVDRALALLKQAGRRDETFELVTAPQVAGIVEAAQVFAKQASDAGVRVKLRKVGTDVFFGDEYKRWPFAQTYWTTRSYFAQVAATHLPKAPYNETHFDDPEFNRLIAQAKRIADDGRRTELLHEAQRIEYDRGGLLIPYFYNVVDAYSTKLVGLKPASTGLPLGNYLFKDVGFAA
ncbi:ABC transporter substrate-binding protein [Patulibacter sp. NPDC049589]|uniref:ABC transporter substrate-binding protein n=1 Tax=Patulibacter sp. NPDC049589 TaxID=3154731 RepID=UPI0034275001